MLHHEAAVLLESFKRATCKAKLIIQSWYDWKESGPDHWSEKLPAACAEFLD